MSRLAAARLALLMAAGLIFVFTRQASAGLHMDLTWDFYNETLNSSFARYHLATLGYSTPRHGDLTLLYDWFDWTQGEDNKHALTPWAAIYTYRYPSAPEAQERRTVQAGCWLVSDIVDHLTDPVILRQVRATYTLERSLDPRTVVALCAALYTPTGLDGLRFTGSATVRRSFGRVRLSLGVNDLSTLDSLLYNAGRTPVTLGVDLPWSAGTNMHAYFIKMLGPEPESMPSNWVRSKSPVIYRLGWDFKMF